MMIMMITIIIITSANGTDTAMIAVEQLQSSVEYTWQNYYALFSSITELIYTIPGLWTPDVSVRAT